jgi:hypothetical protein
MLKCEIANEEAQNPAGPIVCITDLSFKATVTARASARPPKGLDKQVTLIMSRT